MIFHLCSESSNADTAEENSVNEDLYSTIRKRLPLKNEANQRCQKVENGDIYSTVQKKTPNNVKSSINLSRDELVFTSLKKEGCHKKRTGYPEEDEDPIYATIDKKTTLRKFEEDSYSDEEDELMARIEDCEDLAMEALDTAAIAVTGDSTFMQTRFHLHSCRLHSTFMQTRFTAHKGGCSLSTHFALCKNKLFMMSSHDFL